MDKLEARMTRKRGAFCAVIGAIMLVAASCARGPELSGGARPRAVPVPAPVGIAAPTPEPTPRVIVIGRIGPKEPKPTPHPNRFDPLPTPAPVVKVESDRLDTLFAMPPPTNEAPTVYASGFDDTPEGRAAFEARKRELLASAAATPAPRVANPPFGEDASVSGGSASYSPRASSSARSGAGGSVNVKGYFRKDGTFVKGHTRKAPKKRR